VFDSNYVRFLHCFPDIAIVLCFMGPNYLNQINNDDDDKDDDNGDWFKIEKFSYLACFTPSNQNFTRTLVEREYCNGIATR